METPSRNFRLELTGSAGNDEVKGDSQSDDATTGPDPEDNSENSQQLNTDPATDLDTSVPVTIQEDFLRKLVSGRFTLLVSFLTRLLSTSSLSFLLRALFFVTGSDAGTDTSSTLFCCSFVFSPQHLDLAPLEAMFTHLFTD